MWLIAASAQIGCARQTTTSEYELQGRVVSSRDHNHIEGATVSFTSDTLYRASTTTDGDGSYQMVVTTDVDLGQVQVRAAGFQTKESTVLFDTRLRTLDFKLHEAAP